MNFAYLIFLEKLENVLGSLFQIYYYDFEMNTTSDAYLCAIKAEMRKTRSYELLFRI